MICSKFGTDGMKCFIRVDGNSGTGVEVTDSRKAAIGSRTLTISVKVAVKPKARIPKIPEWTSQNDLHNSALYRRKGLLLSEGFQYHLPGENYQYRRDDSAGHGQQPYLRKVSIGKGQEVTVPHRYPLVHREWVCQRRVRHPRIVSYTRRPAHC